MNTPIERLQTALETLGLKAVESRLENLLAVSGLSVNPGSEFIVPPIKASLDEASSADADFLKSWPEGLSYTTGITRSPVEHLTINISGTT